LTVRIVVADDHSLFRDGLVSLLEAAGHQVVGQAGDGEAAVRAVARLKPELVLLDISMPEVDGLEALRRIRATQPEVPVVMLTVSDDDASLFEALRGGAQGYLLKSLNAAEFLAMIDGLGRGEVALSRKATGRVVEGLARRDQATGPQTHLTERELELLTHVARGLSNKAVAAEMSISENTVKYYMKNILQKLGAQNRTEAVAHALRSGLVSDKPPKGDYPPG
jgi:DNA-binding NarL/FixJ family response regulator